MRLNDILFSKIVERGDRSSSTKSGPVEKACDRLHRLISLIAIFVIVHPNDDDDSMIPGLKKTACMTKRV